MQHLGSFLMYEPVIRELAARGHQIHLAVTRQETVGWEPALEKLLADHPQITWGRLAPSRSNSPFWLEMGKTIRLWGDYLRYFEDDYAGAPKLLTRAEERVPPGLVRVTRHPRMQQPDNRRRLRRSLRALERALPPVREIRDYLHEHRPDLVLITPLVFLASWQFDVLRTALAEGYRTAFCVGSWDHLSSKALIRDMPQRVLVWNETQKDEAVRLHGVPADRIRITGAQCYDQWFGRVPTRTRDAFCRHVGLPADRPIVLYVCSALFWGSPVEAEFVMRWVQSLRSSAHPVLRSAAILIRPHPARMDEWKTVDFSALEDVALYGANPMDADSKEDYFESLYYSSAVVGLNTSAFLEAAVVGRPVHTVLTPEFSENQEGTLHFHYLLKVGGGVLQTSRTFDEHHAQLAASLASPITGPTPFVREFIRPHGLDTPGTAMFCNAVDELLLAPAPAPAPAPRRFVLLRWAMYPIGQVLLRVYGAELFRDDWGLADREHQRALNQREREREARRQAAADMQRERDRRRAEKSTARARTLAAAHDAKIRRKEEKAHHKAAQARRHERAAMRIRLKRGAVRWLNRWRHGQAT
jgi:hypothetical protein